jgi:leucine dehydrogenase
VARRAALAGLALRVADLEEGRADVLAREISAESVPALDCLLQPASVLVPCAIGGVIGERVAKQITAWGVCGAANNIFDGEIAERALFERGALVVPDVLASAGAVVDGIGETVMGLSDREPLIERLGTTARSILQESGESGRPCGQIAESRAYERLGERAR